ncbi:MAG: hypothetical protein ACL93V_11835 [Candidatus Electrothrix sp. YB6]
MSRLQCRDQVNLTVRAADLLTEIFLVDSGFQRIASDVGQLETKIGPGIYKARFRVGQRQIDQLIEVKAGAGSLILDGPAVEFASPAPLPQTLTHRKKHQEAAQDFSCAVHLEKGSGSQLYLFIRGLEESAPAPWTGVSLHDLDGNWLAGPEQGECNQEDNFFALNLALDPGTYRLRVEEEPGETYEMFVITAAGWQTQIFALTEAGWLPGVETCRAALPTASVFMVREGQGFTPDDAAFRRTELRRLGLMSRRKILTERTVNSLLKELSPDPMAAIFAAHLLMRQEPADSAAATLLTKGLAPTLREHPDIQALQLHQEPGIRPVFPAPPMLNFSRECLAQAAARGKVIIPPGSLTWQIMEKQVNTPLWFVHRLDNMAAEK